MKMNLKLVNGKIIKLYGLRFLNLSGKEYFEAATINKKKTVKFIIRFIKDINESMILDFEDRKYNITDINNIRYETEAEKSNPKSAKLSGKFYAGDFNGNYRFIIDDDGTGLR